MELWSQDWTAGYLGARETLLVMAQALLVPAPHRSAPLLSREWTGVTVRVLPMWRRLCFACPASIPPWGY